MASPIPWTAALEELEGDGARKLTLLKEGRPLSYAEVLDLWNADADFRDFFREQLDEIPFEAYLWETPPITRATRERSFECVLVDSPTLAEAAAEPAAFADHYGAAPGGRRHLLEPRS